MDTLLPNGLADRQQHLSVPLAPKLLVPSPERWDGLSRHRRADFRLRNIPAPMTDTERILRDTGHPMWGSRRGVSYATHKLNENGFVRDDESGQWEYKAKRPGRGKPMQTMRHHLYCRALIEIAEREVERLEGGAIAGVTAIEATLDEPFIVEHDDPEAFLRAIASVGEGNIDAIVTGVDPVDGSLRADRAVPPAIEHFFGIPGQ